MVLLKCRKALRTLLRDVAQEKPYDRFEIDVPGTMRDCLAPGTLRANGDLDVRYLRLSPATVKRYWECVKCLEAEQVNGDLEHYSTIQIRDALWEAISEAWLRRREGNAAIKRIIDLFIEKNRAPFGKWVVLWEIDSFAVEEPLHIGGVTFFVIGLGDLDLLGLSRLNFFDDRYQDLIGMTFARTTIQAGTRENAISWARPNIDDSLDLLRAGLSRNSWILADQLRFRRGHWSFAYTEDDPEGVVATNAIEERPVGIEVAGVNKEDFDSHVAKWRPALELNTSNKLWAQVQLALRLVGRSTVQSNPDLALVDLCTAMEAILSGIEDKRKGETLVLRFLLLGIYVGDARYEIDPLTLYQAYEARSQLVHGSASRQFLESNVARLRFAVDEMIDRVVQVAAGNSTITAPKLLFTALQQPEYVERARDMVYRCGATDSTFVSKMQDYLDDIHCEPKLTDGH